MSTDELGFQNISYGAGKFQGVTVRRFGHTVEVEQGPTKTTFITCDDCGEAYLGPPYVSFDPAECQETMPGSLIMVRHKDCTGNTCPGCADFLEPDDPEDPRRQFLDEVTGEWSGVKP